MLTSRRGFEVTDLEQLHADTASADGSAHKRIKRILNQPIMPNEVMTTDYMGVSGNTGVIATPALSRAHSTELASAREVSVISTTPPAIVPNASLTKDETSATVDEFVTCVSHPCSSESRSACTLACPIPSSGSQDPSVLDTQAGTNLFELSAKNSSAAILSDHPADSAWAILFAVQGHAVSGYVCEDIWLPRGQDTWFIVRDLGDDPGPKPYSVALCSDVVAVQNHCEIARQLVSATRQGTRFLISLDHEHRSNLVYTIRDLSSDGICLNNHRLGPGIRAIIRDGDTVRFDQGDNSPFTYRWHTFDPVACSDPDAMGGLLAAYKLANDIGEGCFGLVKRCIQRSTGDWYAVKICSKTKHVYDEQLAKNLRRELDIVQNLPAHNNIIKYHERFEDANNVYIVLELVNGGDLLHYLVEHEIMEELTIAKLTNMICTGVSVLHRAGIVNRDIKPDNLLMTAGNNPVCKVADFGLARAFSPGEDLTTRCGTMTYLAPEVLVRTDKKGYDQAVDAWAIGASQRFGSPRKHV
ncbi:uncharacterized protein L969DRAFT_94194 [Mixia osmundae IAM 14324]|uniref:Protein kinase domain-containing protein n=1 Tax=Mixia osmundae (strain CBS 9802 / IAM 14324 / JCM 22182 / KY 12970) TaxID=764103 RepID=G7E6I5_MIXOS|nr:uncharacterized protein L969DRAFT_94194 [Mixia osmundae IAM 14324]KEI40397.1 hypothetical protein L969DRAFT_94194 [Mixia osmundae IAM 14324]GAA98445.1 hypothetical protein E5Q_05131 [Mixia osmundae IAM 14324]